MLVDASQLRRVTSLARPCKRPRGVKLERAFTSQPAPIRYSACAAVAAIPEATSDPVLGASGAGAGGCLRSDTCSSACEHRLRCDAERYMESRLRCSADRPDEQGQRGAAHQAAVLCQRRHWCRYSRCLPAAVPSCPFPSAACSTLRFPDSPPAAPTRSSWPSSRAWPAARSLSMRTRGLEPSACMPSTKDVPWQR